MEASEAAEIIRNAGEAKAEGERSLRFHRAGALITAVLASLLAVATIGTGAATRAQLKTNIRVADLRSTTDSASLRQYDAEVATQTLESLLDAIELSDPAHAAIEQRIAAYRVTIAQLEGSAQSGSGIKGGEAQVSALEGAEFASETRILSFEYSEVALQVAIVLTSVAILTDWRPLLYTCLGLGITGTFLLLNGFVLFSNVLASH